MADADAVDVYAHYALESGFRPYAYASHVDFDGEDGVDGDRQVYAVGLSYAFTPGATLSLEVKRNELNEFSGESTVLTTAVASTSLGHSNPRKDVVDLTIERLAFCRPFLSLLFEG